MSSPEISSSAFELPEMYQFPPFFTIQPVVETRKKQLKVWQDLILSWHKVNGAQSLNINEWELFQNQSINRKVDTDGRKTIVEHLVKTGHAEWKDDSMTSCWIMWRSPNEIANRLYSWIQDCGMIGTVYTVFELTNGDEVKNTEFENIDMYLMRKALEILEKQEKATIFKGSTSDEDGIKFF